MKVEVYPLMVAGEGVRVQVHEQRGNDRGVRQKSQMYNQDGLR